MSATPASRKGTSVTPYLVARPGNTPWPFEELAFPSLPSGRLGRYVLGFGQDADGELYVLTTGNPGPTGTTGRVYRLVD